MMHMHASPKIDYFYCAAIKQITVSLFPKLVKGASVAVRSSGLPDDKTAPMRGRSHICVEALVC